MAILLSLETSTGVCSAALHDDGKLLASLDLQLNQSTGSSLSVMIDNLIKLCNLSPSDLKGVAIAEGPGSYTGLRIGVATAKGICFSLKIPLLAVNTLELMTSQVIASLNNIMPALTSNRDQKVFLCPMLDARRMEVYCLVADKELVVLESTSAKVIDGQSFNEWLEQGIVLFFGNGAEKCREILQHPNAYFLKGIIPAASSLGELAFKKFENGDIEQLSSFEPLYLKDFVAKKPKMQI